MSILDGLTDEAISLLIAAEIRAASPLTLKMDARTAFTPISLLQLACLHPGTTEDHRELVKDFIRQAAPIGPATAAIFELGWDRTKDRA